MSTEPTKKYLDIEALAEVSKARATSAEDGPEPDYLLTFEPPPVPEDLHTPYSVSFVEWEGFFTRDFTSQDWLVEPFLVKGRAHAVVAEAKTGKSLLALEIGMALACGKPVFDHPPTPPVHVLYVDHEMTEVDLWERASDLGYSEHDEQLLTKYFHYSLLPAAEPADSPEGGAQLALTAALVGAELVILDTYSRSVDGPENDADTTRNFFTHTGRLLKQGGITVLRLDHLGKDKTRGGRGSSAKNDDVDIVYSLVKTGTPNQFTLRTTHTRVGWVPHERTMFRHDDPLRHSLVGDVEVREDKVQQILRVVQDSPHRTNQAIRLHLRAKGLSYSNAAISEAVRRLKDEDE